MRAFFLSLTLVCVGLGCAGNKKPTNNPGKATLSIPGELKLEVIALEGDLNVVTLQDNTKAIEISGLKFDMTDAQFVDLAKAIQNAKQPVSLQLKRNFSLTPKILKHLSPATNVVALYYSNETLDENNIAPIGKLTNLRVLDLDVGNANKVTEKMISHLAPLVKLRRLSLIDSVVTFHDGHLEHLQHLKNLQQLPKVFVDGENFTEKGMASLQHLGELQELCINVPEKGFEHLSSLKKLESLVVYGPGTMSSKTMETIASLPNLQDLTLNFDQIDKSVGESLAKIQTLRKLSLNRRVSGIFPSVGKLKNLEVLSLMLIEVNDKQLGEICKLTKLKELMCSGSQLTNKGLLPLMQLSEMENLSINLNKKITDDALKFLQSMTKLKRLTLIDGAIVGKGLTPLAKMKHLTHCTLSGNPIEDKYLKVFELSPQLESLEFEGTNVSDEALSKLAKKYPKMLIRGFAGQFISATGETDDMYSVSRKDISKEKVAHTFSASEFFADVAKNPKQKVEQYEKKVVRLTGVVTKFGWQIGSGAFVELKAGKEYNQRLKCYADNQHIWEKVFPGQTITLRGEAKGGLINGGSSLYLKYCVLQKAEPFDRVQFSATDFVKLFEKGGDQWAKHDGKWIEVTGKVRSLKYDSFGEATVILEGTEKTPLKFEFDSYPTELRKIIRPGQTATIIGYNYGYERETKTIDFTDSLPVRK